MVYNLALEKNSEAIRERLREAKNPLIFFDDDPDGLCSFLLLFHFMGKGNGIPLKTAPILNSSFLKKVEEYFPDVIFVLDIPNIEREFIEGVYVPIIWIDHHLPVVPVQEKKVTYLNPRSDNNMYLPTSYLCQKIVGQQEWLGICGSVADHYIPEYFAEFKKKYPELFPQKDSIGEIRYASKFGELIGLVSFLLKGKTSEVKHRINLLKKMDFEEIIAKKTAQSKALWENYEGINQKYVSILQKAEKNVSTDNFLIYLSGTEEDSFVGDMANELIYKYPKKIVIVGRTRNGFVRMSMRSAETDILPLLKKSMAGLKGYCGGHEKACGGNIDERDFGIFLERFRLSVEEARRN